MVSKEFPESNVTANLMLVDKSVVCPVDGLNQCFRVFRNDEHSGVEQVKDFAPEALKANILKSIPVDHECDVIYALTEHGNRFRGSFSELIKELSGICDGSVLAPITIRGDCGNRHD